MKMSERELELLLDAAVQAAVTAGNAKLAELKNAGPKYAVHNGDVFTGKPVGPAVGTMLDLCGFAYCFIPKRVLSTRSKAVKALLVKQRLSNWDYERALMVRLPHIDQAISVNEAAAQAAVEVLKQNGIDAYMSSRLD